MTNFFTSRLLVIVGSTLAFVLPAAAQTMTPDASATNASAPVSAKMQRKIARKQARKKNDAELKKLEDAGYQPAIRNPDYPNDIQAAEKKVQAGTPASQ
ncbi:MAG: hypothetical protein ACRYG5_14395 [Janthinobacterium lividum]